MDDKIADAKAYLTKVPFPEMHLGPDGTIWAKPNQDRQAVLVATMNLRDLTLTEAFAFASAFIASGEALCRAPTGTDQEP